MGAQRGEAREVKTPQINIFAIPYRVTVSGGVVSQTNHLGGESITVTRSSAGVFVLTLKTPARRGFITPGGPPVSETADLKATSNTPSSSAVTFTFTNNSGTATDPTGFSGVLYVHDDIVLRG